MPDNHQNDAIKRTMASSIEVSQLIKQSIQKLEYFQHLQQASFVPLNDSKPPLHSDTSTKSLSHTTTPTTTEKQANCWWYLGSFKLSPSQLDSINKKFNSWICDDDFYAIACKLGTVSLQGISNGDELQLQLYQFNETLTRLFKDHNGSLKEPCSAYDTDLIMTSVVSLLISKLSDLLRTLQEGIPVEPVAIGLVHNIVKKIIRGRILLPYHEMILREMTRYLDERIPLVDLWEKIGHFISFRFISFHFLILGDIIFISN